MNLEFFSELHEREFTKKDRLADRASSIIALLTALVGALGFFIVNHKWEGHATDLVFGGLAAIALILLGRSAYCLARSYQVPNLVHIGRAKQWLSYWQELKAKHGVPGGNPSLAQAEFSDYLIELYAETSESNITANRTRGTRLVKSNNALLVSMLFVVLTALAWYYNVHVRVAAPPVKGEFTMLTTDGPMTCALLPSGVLATERPRPRPEPEPDPCPSPNHPP